MTEDAEHTGMDYLPPEEGFNQPKRYRIKYRCRRCGKTYKGKITTSPSLVDEPCPRIECVVARATEAQAAEIANLRQMLEEQRTPGVIGANNSVKAVDETAKIVMEDYKLTDLRDNIREGDIVAPKLPPRQQQAADNFFKPSAAAKQQGNERLRQRVQNLGLLAMKGALGRPAFDPGMIAAKAGLTPETPALRRLRTEGGDAAKENVRLRQIVSRQ
jgi:predicted  nucleic acid-binding Zn-ribbon protein